MDNEYKEAGITRNNIQNDKQGYQSYNSEPENHANAKPSNKLAGQDRKSASSVGSTKTIESMKRPSENFLGNFFMPPNKSPPRPHSPRQGTDFMNMTSLNLQRHNNLTASTFNLYNKNNSSSEDVSKFLSRSNTPSLLKDEKKPQTSRDTLILQYENRVEGESFEGLKNPTRANTGTTSTTNRSDVVMSHQSHPSTATACESEIDKANLNVLHSPAGDFSNSPKDLTGKFSGSILDEDPDKTLENRDIEEANSIEKHQKGEIGLGMVHAMISPDFKDPPFAAFDKKFQGGQFDGQNGQQQRYMFHRSNPEIDKNTFNAFSQQPSNKGSPSPKMQYYQMTPSQRLRYRREQGKNKVKNSSHFKEYVYDKLENIEKNYYQNGNIYSLQPPPIRAGEYSQNNLPKKKLSLGDSPLVWNVPMSSSGAAVNGFGNSSFSSTKNSSVTSISMPMTPIFGVSQKSDLIDSFNKTALDLSQLYINEESRKKEEKLNQRKQETEFLPEALKEATRKGFEDATFVSREKLNSISSSRPSWLPVKDSRENEKHELEIYRTVSTASIDKLNFTKKFENLPEVVTEMKIKFDKQFNVDSEKDQIINSTGVFNGLCKILWDYPCITNIDNRFNTYHKLLLADIYSSKCFPENNRLQKFPGLDYCLKPSEEMNQIIKKTLSQYDEQASVENRLHSFRKIPSILQQLVHSRNRDSGDAEITKSVVLYDLLLRAYGVLDIELPQLQNFENRTEIEYIIRKIWDLEQLLSKICFNKTVEQKYNDRIMNKKGLLAQYMKTEYGFDLEFTAENLQFKNFFQILNKMPNKLSLWVLDCIVLNNTALMNKNDMNYYLDKVASKFETACNKNKEATYDYWINKYSTNNYKILISLTLSVLLNYHFGYSDFTELSEISLINYNLLGLSNKPIIDILTSAKPPNFKRYSRAAKPATSLSRSSSGLFIEPRHSSVTSASIRSSNLNITIGDYDEGSEDYEITNNDASCQTGSVETIDFMNLTSLDLMGVKNYSCQEEDEDEYISMESFMKKWAGYYRKM